MGLLCLLYTSCFMCVKPFYQNEIENPLFDKTHQKEGDHNKIVY